MQVIKRKNLVVEVKTNRAEEKINNYRGQDLSVLGSKGVSPRKLPLDPTRVQFVDV